MMKLFFCFMLWLGFSLISTNLLARDPFMPLFPKKIQTEPDTPIIPSIQPNLLTPEEVQELVELQGVFWEIDTPQVIIDGQIYSEQDTVDGMDAEIIKIDKNNVTIRYGEGFYILNPRK